MPTPNTTTAKQRTLPTPTAPIAAGPSRPTMAMSTSPIAIHPSSATTIGVARRTVGGSSPRSARRAEPAAAGRAGGVLFVAFDVRYPGRPRCVTEKIVPFRRGVVPRAALSTRSPRRVLPVRHGRRGDPGDIGSGAACAGIRAGRAVDTPVRHSYARAVGVWQCSAGSGE